MRPGQDLNWLITAFADRVPSVGHALVVSSDGLPLAFSQGLPPDRVDQLAAVTSGLNSLVEGASRIFEGGPVSQTVVEMSHGLLIVMAVTGGSTLAVLAGAWFAVGSVLTPLWTSAGLTGTPVGGQVARVLEQIGFFTGLGVAIVCDSGWAILAGRLRALLVAHARLRNRITGGLLVSAGLGLAMARRSS